MYGSNASIKQSKPETTLSEISGERGTQFSRFQLHIVIYSSIVMHAMNEAPHIKVYLSPKQRTKLVVHSNQLEQHPENVARRAIDELLEREFDEQVARIKERL